MSDDATLSHTSAEVGYTTDNHNFQASHASAEVGYTQDARNLLIAHLSVEVGLNIRAGRRRVMVT